MSLELRQAAEFLASLPYRTSAQLLVAYGVGGEFDYSTVLLEIESAYERPQAKWKAARRAARKLWLPIISCEFDAFCAGEAQLDILEASQIAFALMPELPLTIPVVPALDSPYQERRGVLSLPVEVQSQTEALCALFLDSLAPSYRQRLVEDCELFIRPAPEEATKFEAFYSTLSVALSLYWQGHIGADLAVEFFNAEIPTPEPKELCISFAGLGLGRLISPVPPPPFTPSRLPAQKVRARMGKVSERPCDLEWLRWLRGSREN